MADFALALALEFQIAEAFALSAPDRRIYLDGIVARDMVGLLLHGDHLVVSPFELEKIRKRG